EYAPPNYYGAAHVQSMKRTTSPEMNALVGCVRAFLSPGGGAALETGVAQPLDWDALLRMADDHSVTPLVAYVVCEQEAGLAPAKARRRLQERFLQITKNNLAGLQEWRRLLRALGQAGVPVITFKGPALGLSAYGNVALREFHDLDLLVRPEHIGQVRDLLVRDGYSLWSPLVGGSDAALARSSNRQVCFTNKERGTSVDLHWGALHEMFSFQLEGDELWRGAYVERNEEMAYLALSPEHLLLYLCAHGAKHCWRNLCWLSDIACHVQSHPATDWEACTRMANSSGCGLLLEHTLLLAEQVLGLQVPGGSRSYEDDESAQALADMAQAFLFREHGEHPGYLGPLRYHLALAKGWREGASLFFQRVFVPAEPDWDRVRLPRPFHFLYYVVRPVRFVVERIMVAGRSSR
ncbi:MAG: nucleotidyltransferase family protein, partial [Candidatus Korobacteraceae bacterium]